MRKILRIYVSPNSCSNPRLSNYPIIQAACYAVPKSQIT
jgi:hypothetical protein